jgi:hypothetical protein
MVLRVGDRVRFDGLAQTVVGLSGTLVRLADEQGRTSVVHLPHLLAADGFEHLGERVAAPALPPGLLHAVPQEAIEQAQWWEHHIVEVITGKPPDADPGARPRLGYDPAMHSLVQREQAKATELAAQGREVSTRTLKRKRHRYEAQGLVGLIDWRVDRHRSAHGRADGRVVDALRQAIEEATDRSTRTVTFLQDGHGASALVLFAHLVAAEGFELLAGQPTAVPLPPFGMLDNVPGPVLDRAQLWERHLIEVETGLPPDSAEDARPRPE